MTPTTLLQLLPGPFNFLHREPAELRALVPDLEQSLPQPRPVFLAEEGATPVRGFPVLLSDGLAELRQALERYLVAEEAAQVAIFQRRPSDRLAVESARERYRALLARAVENVTLSSYGRNFPAVFWLSHSLDTARVLKESPRRALRLDLEVGRRHGDAVKYRVLERFLDFVTAQTYDLVSRLADDTEEIEEELFPRLLTRMRDNVLILTEDHISRDLAELSSYFAGYLHIDGRDLRRRLGELGTWNAELLRADHDLRNAVRHLLRPEPEALGASEPDPAEQAHELLNRPGYVRYLSTRRDYPADRLFDQRLVQVWESLLLKLKEFELLHALRRYLLPVALEDGRMVCRSPGAGRALPVASGTVFSTATRPLDFMAPWVVDPLVHRFGLIYDLTDFSDIVNVVRRSGTELQDDAFRKMFTFQRRLNRLAAGHRLTLEKYLGDGAFYSSRRCAGVVVTAVQIQRSYREALTDGFPFDRGLRIALNYGQYRLIPIGSGIPEGPDRYEFFGHGLVELSRLITGKATREIEDIKTMLIARGYPEQTVYRFFSPLLKSPERPGGEAAGAAGTFYAYINQHGNLVNEGMVATEAFIAQLDRELGDEAQVHRVRRDGRIYVVTAAEVGSERVHVGLRRLGNAHLKGLGDVPVLEVVDAGAWGIANLGPATSGSLLAALDRNLADSYSAAGRS